MKVFKEHIIIYSKIFLFSIVFLLIFCQTGCSVFKKATQESPQAQNAEKLPRQLGEIEKTIDKIYLALGEKRENEDDNQEQLAKDDNQSQQNNDEQPAEDPWEKITQEIKSLHLIWNSTLPEMTKKGAKKELIDSFSQALNHLTKIALTKDKNQVLLSTNHLYRHIPDMYTLYPSDTFPELKRLLYHCRNIVFYSYEDDWDKSTKSMEELSSLWSMIQNTIAKEKQEESIKLDLSIYELEKVVKEKNKELVKIKGNISITNIETMQEG